MKRYFGIGAFALAASAMLAQQVDDPAILLQKLEKATHDTARVKLLLELSVAYKQKGDKEQSKERAEKALELAEKNNFQVAQSKRTLAIAWRNMGEFDTSLALFRQALAQAEQDKDKREVADVKNDMGVFYYQQQMFDSSLHYFIGAVKIREEIKDFGGLGASYNNIGQIYGIQERWEKSQEYFEKALAIFENEGNRLYAAMVTNNIGNVYKTGYEDYKKALAYYLEALQIVDSLNVKPLVGQYLNNLGNTYSRLNNIAEALVYLKKSAAVFSELGDKSNYAFTIHNIAYLYYELKQYQTALDWEQQSFEIGRQNNDIKRLRESYLLFSSCYENLGDYKKAHEYYRLQDGLEDSLAKIQNKEALNQLEVEYETEKKEQQIKLQEAEISRQQEEVKRQNFQKIAFAGGLGLVALFSFFLYNRFRITRRQKAIIERQKHVVDEKNKEILDSIAYAKRLQSAILPPPKLVKEYLPESFILYKPKDIVAGDFYWMEAVGGTTLFAAADCTGHGVPGAMVSVVCNNALNRSVKEFGITEPAKILDKVRELVIETFEKSEDEVKDGMDIALCALDNNSNTVHYSGANNPLWLIRNNELLETKADNQPIGKYIEKKPFTGHSVRLQQGDALYIFSDGYADQFGGERGKKLKAKPFKELLLSIHQNPMAEQRNTINQFFEEWKGELEQLDDVCVIGVRV